MHKVTIIGDSISMAYGPVVKERLTGWAEVWQSEENGGTSAHVLEHLDEWALDREADVIHFNCGLHDLAIDDGANNRIALPAYAENLRAIVTRLRKGTKATLIWATTTPVVDEWHAATKGFLRRQADVERYNAAAREMAEGLHIDDLHAVVIAHGVRTCVCEDGVHMTEPGNQWLAEAVEAAIRAAL